MDEKIIKYSDEGNISALTQAIASLKSQKLIDLLEARALEGRGDPVAYIKAVLKGSPVSSTDGFKRTLLFYKHCISLLNDGDVPNKTAAEIIGFLMMELDTLPGKALTELTEVFLDGVKGGTLSNGKSLELFPKILSAIAVKDSVPVGLDSCGEMSGSEYKSQLLNTLCSSRWDPQCVVHLAAMFRDIPMSSDELRFVIEKILRLFKDLDLQELPPLAYQLLLLSTKGHKRLVLEGVTTFFNHQDDICRKEDRINSSELRSISKDQLRHMEGTVILHVTFAIKQDQELGRELIKYLKAYQNSPSHILTPYTVALALSVTQIHRFEENVFDFLKASIIKSFKDDERRSQSKWIKENVPETSEVYDHILETVQNSLFGWDHVTHGLVQLGFILMDCFGPKTFDTQSSSIASPAQQACKLGSALLLDTFKAHEMVRTEILQQILNRVITKATTPVSHFVDLLSSAVASAPHVLLESLPKVKEALDYLSFLPPSTAVGLLKALQPLMKISLSLRDTLILVLRKAMFSRQLDARKIAVSGFLLILKHFKVMGGGISASSQLSQTFSQSSQVQADVHIQGGAGNEALCLEILGNLRRCFTQQADVRVVLYEGLYDVMRRNPQLRQPILDALFVQFQKYYEPADDVTPPVKLDTCLSAAGDQVFLAEPLGHLLSALQQCTLWISDNVSNQDDDDDDNDKSVEHIFNMVEDTLQSLTQRMIKSELEDFELDKSADFSTANSVGVKNNIFARLVLGLYELLLEFTFTEGEFSRQSIEEVLQLFGNYHNLAEILQEKTAALPGKKGRTASSSKHSSSSSSHSMLSLGCIAEILVALFTDVIPSHQESINFLRADGHLVKFILNTALQKLRQIADGGSCNGPRGCDKEYIYKQCCTVARVFMRHISGTSSFQEDASRKDKGKKVSSLCLDGLCLVVTITCHHYPSKLISFLSFIETSLSDNEEANETVGDQERIYAHIRRLQRLIMDVISSSSPEESDMSVKDTTTLVHVLSQLSQHLDPEQQQFSELHSWVHTVCKEQNVDDTALTKALITLLASLTFRCKTSVSLIREIAQDVHSQLGDIDEDIEVENRTHFAIINQRTAAPTVTLVLMHQIDTVLEEVDWTMVKIRADLTLPPSGSSDDKLPSSPDNTQRNSLETAICHRLIGLVMAFHELAQSALPDGPCTEATLKALTKLYVSLGSVAKYYTSLYNQRLGYLSPKFEKLVKLSGTHLSQQVYALITYIQSAQALSLQEHVGKAKKKAPKGQAVPGKAKVMKEMKFIPNLIYAIEQYEKFLIQLSKKSKINLMEHIKRSTARDFRINGATLEAALREESSDEEDEEGESTSENEEPPKKKGKLDEGKRKKGKEKGGKLSTKKQSAARAALGDNNAS
ncbi:Fanconi anemia group I protein isoform X2 [Nematostella vectensis]|uniref:Fanconi anemia group I protein isoform X2 n=1 Tax=Nematostella vectensis TaxID=45351 RepID=UPI002076DE65|nr:Fanconi anemia group I protein isoform X2 [Nematostella vectensis]